MNEVNYQNSKLFRSKALKHINKITNNVVNINFWVVNAIVDEKIFNRLRGDNFIYIVRDVAVDDIGVENLNSKVKNDHGVADINFNIDSEVVNTVEENCFNGKNHNLNFH